MRRAGKFRILQFAGAILLSGASACCAAEDFVWIEGEAPKTQNVTRHPWWYDKIKPGELSGGALISNWSKDKAGDIAYAFEIPARKEYALWVRANPIQSKLSFQIDGGAWQAIDMTGSVGNVNIAEDGKPDLRFVAWLKAGVFTLAKGPHTAAFRMDSANNNHGMLDCFVFSSIPFEPDGILKPGQRAPPPASAEGRWAFSPPKDMFDPGALFDLRSLNEKTAGESGYVVRSKDGNDFLLANGKPARFWALNTGAYNRGNVDLARHARFLAKRGVNMVRFHGNLTAKAGALSDIDKEEREKLWKLVAAMKKEGIYTTFSPYWAVSSHIKPERGVLDAGKGGNMGLLFFDKKLQEAYKAWMRQALAEKNPHTGIPLALDPALAIVQLQNEDSLLFWSSQQIEGAAAKELRRQFGSFLAKKYGSLEKARDAWGGAGLPADDFAAGEAALYGVWEMTQRRAGSQHKRIGDQLQFFTEAMYAFNKTMGDFIHGELGCKALINAGNWRTADNVLLLDAERHSYSANEVMGVNRYCGGAHEGQYAGWAIVKGDKFTDESVLLNPRELPIALKQVDGFPMIVSESSWVPPQGYQSEGPFLIAAYQSLSGVDAYYWFATGEEDWRHPGSSNGYLPSEGKWVCATPMLMGQWPAAALLYRMSYVKQGAPAVYEERALADLWERRMPIIAEDAGYDPNRDKDNLTKESNVKGGADPLAFYVGPVTAKYGGDPARSKVQELGTYIDTAAKKVKSATGELQLDHGNGVCILDSPKAQGAAGFLKKAPAIKLSSVEIQCANEYASVLVVALDDRELKRSAKVLVQVGTTERPTDWATKPAKVGKRDGEEIVNHGKAPWQIVNADLTVTISNSALKTARVLDANGMPVRDIPLKESNGAKQFIFPADALYAVLE